MDLTVDAVLFDLDGTLIDSTKAVERAWATWAREYQLGRGVFDGVHSHGRPSQDLVADLLPADQVAEGTRRIDELELSDLEGVVVLPGSRKLLEALPSDRWAVVTSGNRALATRRMGVTGLRAPVLVTADDVSRGKPDPEPFTLAAHRLGVLPRRCAVFEDAPAGLTAAEAAGMHAIGVATTYQREELRGRTVVDDLSAVTVLATEPRVTLRIAE